MLGQPGGEGLGVSHGTSNCAGETKLLQTRPALLQCTTTTPHPKIGSTNTPSSNLHHLHLLLSLIVHFFSNHTTFLQHLYNYPPPLTLQQFLVSPVSCWHHYASVSSSLQSQPAPPSSQVDATGPTTRGRCPTDSRNVIKAQAHHGSQTGFERHRYLVLNRRTMLRHLQLDPQHLHLSRLRGSYRFPSFNCIISFTEVTFIVRSPPLVNIRTLILI